ncbi:MAG: GspE/PulE family protein [Candidatus Babeliaceae bacterium]
MEDAPVIQIVDELITGAIARNASDIHLESTKNNLRVRFRIDGLLYDQNLLAYEISQQIIARIKVCARLDVAERRIPQDGKLCVQNPQGEIDIRVSTFPGLHGEKVVLRILNRFTQLLNCEYLGLASAMLTDLQQLLQRSSGFFLVTGPTGSGKTTTLYALLQHIQSPTKNIVTLEDPIEYSLAGITQGPIHPHIGFTFAQGIRALLRQDPDIILVGEIRDYETAQVAIQAALTGHFVLSTVHTHDAPGTIMRLLDMGIEPFLLSAALSGVLAQRLARKLCQECVQEKAIAHHEMILIERYKLPIQRLFESIGCQKCNFIGCKGRVGIFEFLKPSASVRALINHQPELDALYEQAHDDGMCSLLHDGAHKVNEGVISLQELLRVAA